MSRSKKLTRQIIRYLGLANAEEEIAALTSSSSVSLTALPPAAQTVIRNFSTFLDIVHASYEKYEENIAVAERNLNLSSRELIQADHAINTMVNCLGQGFLIFDRNGLCASVYSHACQALLETTPAGKHIGDVLHLNGEERTRLMTLIRLAFEQKHAMGFEEIMRLAPHSYRHSGGRHIQIDYKCLPDPDGRLDEIVMIATDVTDQVKAQNLAEEQQAMFLSIERVLHDRRAFGTMIRQLQEVTALSDQALREPANLREVHTLKSSAGIFKLPGLVKVLHEMESSIKTAKTMSGLRTLLAEEVAAVIARFDILIGDDVTKLEAVGSLDKTTLRHFADYLGAQGQTEIRQEFLRQVCTESLIRQLRSFDMMLDDLAVNFGKKIKPLQFAGRDILLVPDHYAALLRSLAHIFRNMIIHGIEAPSDRTRYGKEETGNITIALALDDSAATPVLRFTLSDDGAGIDVAKLRAKLVAENPGGGWRRRPEADVLDQIFSLGFSTSTHLTPGSGRGIGLNAVRHEVEKLGGTITVTSKPGQGAHFHIAVPFVLNF